MDRHFVTIGDCQLLSEAETYKVLLRQEGFEVALPGSRKDAISAGFRLLARYIFGGNSAKGKVAMTARSARPL